MDNVAKLANFFKSLMLLSETLLPFKISAHAQTAYLKVWLSNGKRSVKPFMSSALISTHLQIKMR